MMHGAPERPVTLQGDLRNLPPALDPLKALPNWVCWRWEWRVDKKGFGKWTKPPLQPDNPQRYARNNDPTTWGTYEQAVAAFEAGQCDGIGFNLSGTDIAAFDLDDSRDPATGDIAPEAMSYVDRAASYTELSVSGSGLHIIGYGYGAKMHRKQKIPGSSVEVESYRGAERYIVITGNPLPGILDKWPHMVDIGDEIDAVVAELDGLKGAGSNSNTTNRDAPPDDDNIDANSDIDPFLEASLPPDLLKLVRDGVPVGERSDQFFHVVRWLKDLQWSLSDIVALLNNYPDGIANKYVAGNRVAAEAHRAYSKPGTARTDGKATHMGSLPVIDVRGGELSKLATQGEEILHAAGVQIFQRSRQLVRPVIEEVDATRGRKTKICQLIPVVPDYLRDLLCRHARWQRYDARCKEYVPINPPRDIAATILARTGEWRLFPAVCGVTSAPTMRPDGSLVTEPGFDQKTGLLLVEPPPMPAIPDKPTKADAEVALKLLEDLLVGFPFIDDVARAGALSALVTAVARGAFPVAPLHASRAPTAGSGKSFLWDVIAAIIIGQPMPVISTGKDEIEMEKRLGAALMTGQPLISIDNISGDLGGDALCQIIERPVVDIRVLGQSKNMRIEARGTSLYATGNNFTLVGDICRRVITINLDAGMERPELRQFDFDPIERVLADRGKYIAAALTICRAYFVAGRPDKAPKLASFEGWSDTVRSALLWLGKEDPVKSMEFARQEDPELLELAEMLEAWSEVMGTGGDSRAKLSDVLLRCDAMCRESEDGELVPMHPRLNAALKAVGQRYLGKPALPDARLLGKWLQRFKGRPVGGMKFMNQPDQKHGAQWWVEGNTAAGG